MRAQIRVWVGLLAALLLATPTRAQNINLLDTGAITANSSGGACTAVPQGCAIFQIGNAAIASVTLQVSGTYVGTLGAFEATSSDNPTTGTWFAITGIDISTGASATAVTANATGQFSFQNSGLTYIRVRATAWTSGTAVVTAVRGYAAARWLSPFFTRTLVGNGTAAAPSYSFANDPDTGIYNPSAANGIALTFGGVNGYYIQAAQLDMKSTNVFGWATGDPTSAGCDTCLARDAANTLAQRNGTNAQSYRWYFTTTGPVYTSLTARTAGSVLTAVGGAMQLSTAQTTAPTCSANCGTSPSVVGTDTAGIVTMGATGVPASGWVITFNGTWPAAPSCSVTMAKAGMADTKRALTVVSSTTIFTVVTNGAAPANGDIYSYHCIGVS